MNLRIEFVERAKAGESIAALCREFKISRTTGHKWQKRFKAQGFEGLEEQSRRPKTAPLATGEELVMAILEARDRHARWGPRKLYGLLRRRFGDQTPSERTIARILRRADRVRERLVALSGWSALRPAHRARCVQSLRARPATLSSDYGRCPRGL